MAKSKVKDSVPPDLQHEAFDEFQEPLIEQEEALVPADPIDIDDVFSRTVNSDLPAGIRIGRVLTVPLVSMAKRSGLFFKATSEMYTRALPILGSKGDGTPPRLVDGIDLQTGEEIMLVIHEMMASAMQRAGFAIVAFIKGEKPSDTKQSIVSGKPLTSSGWAFRAGSINDGKRYRVVETATLVLDQE